MSEFLTRMLILFFPGIISLVIIDKLTAHKKINQFYFFVYSFILGVLSYLLVYSVADISFLKPITGQIEKKYFLEFVESGKYGKYNPFEIALASLMGIIIAIMFCYLKNFKWLYKPLQFLRITSKFSDPDVLRYFLSSKEVQGWIYIRDITRDICYLGWLTAFSENPEDSLCKEEILLSDVRIYTNTSSELLYRCDYLYLPFKAEDMIIEYIKSEEEPDQKEIVKNSDSDKKESITNNLSGDTNG